MKKMTSESQQANVIAQLDALDAMSDDQIDYSDAPALDDWSGAVRSKYYKPNGGKPAALPKRIAMPEPVAAEKPGKNGQRVVSLASLRKIAAA